MPACCLSSATLVLAMARSSLSMARRQHPVWATLERCGGQLLTVSVLYSSPLRISVKSTVPLLSFARRCFRSLAFHAILRTRLLQASMTFMPFRHRMAAIGTMGLCRLQQRQVLPRVAPTTTGVLLFPPLSPARVVSSGTQAKNSAKRTVRKARA